MNTKDFESTTEDRSLLDLEFSDALMGYGTHHGESALAIYDYDQCVQTLMDSRGWTYREAREHMELRVPAHRDWVFLHRHRLE